MSRPPSTIPPLKESRIRLRPGTITAYRRLSVANGRSLTQEIQAALDAHIERLSRLGRKGVPHAP